MDVPKPGERVFYFPQGHMEQVQYNYSLCFHCFCFPCFQKQIKICFFSFVFACFNVCFLVALLGFVVGSINKSGAESANPSV